MSSDDEEEPEYVESTDKAYLRGKLKQLGQAISKLKTDDKEKLIPDREVIRDYIKELNKKKVTLETYFSIKGKYEDEWLPDAEDYGVNIEGEPNIPKKSQEKINRRIKSEIESIQSRISRYKRKITKQTDAEMKDLLSEPRDRLKRLSDAIHASMTEEEVEKIRRELIYSIVPEIDALIREKTKKKDEANDLERDISRLKSLIFRYYITILNQHPKIKRELYPEREELESINKKLMQDKLTRKSLENQEDILENDIIPEIDALIEKKGRKYKDDDDGLGVSKKELKCLERQQEAAEIKREIKEYERNERRRRFLKLNEWTTNRSPQQNMGPRIDLSNIILMKIMNETFGGNRQNQSNTQLNFAVEELRSVREAQARTQDKNTEFRRQIAETQQRNLEIQMDYLRRNLENTGQANRDPIEELKQKKKDLEYLDIKQPEATSTEEKSLTMTKDVKDTGMEEVDQRAQMLEKATQHILDDQLDCIMQPPQMSAGMQEVMQPQPGMGLIPAGMDDEQITLIQRMLEETEKRIQQGP